MTELFKTLYKKNKVSAEMTSINGNKEQKIEVKEVYFKDSNEKEINLGLILSTGQKLTFRFNKE